MLAQSLHRAALTSDIEFKFGGGGASPAPSVLLTCGGDSQSTGEPRPGRAPLWIPRRTEPQRHRARCGRGGHSLRAVTVHRRHRAR